ncbi:MAG: MBOAT family O-acyltransferase [Methylophilaceae bacterium]
MIFHSLKFVVFFGVVYAIYLSLRHKAQNRFLLAASYLFYSTWDWRFLVLIIITTLTDHLCATSIHATSDKARRQRYVAISVIVNLGILGVFKYYNFFLENFISLFSTMGYDISGPTINILLPVGISFYTFQSMSYTLDVYRKQLKPADNVLDYALYVSFFPQLVAGPIERAKNLLPQVLSPRTLTYKAAQQALVLIAIGVFKKLFIADNLGDIVDPVFAVGASPSSTMVLVAGYAFLFQVYCDFSAYTDIARGVSKLMGFELMDNFRAPYLARNLQDFWNRWHISLTTWIRDYLYYPLAFARFKKKSIPPYFVTVLTFTIMGLWHGAAWGYVLWGVYNGIALAAYGLISRYLPKVKKDASALLKHATNILCVLVTFHVIFIGDIFFRAVSFDQSSTLITTLFTQSPFTGELITQLKIIGFYILPIFLMDFFTTKKPIEDRFYELPVPLRYGVMYILFYLVYFYGTSKPSFIYFQF